MTEWLNRPLEKVYPVIFIDAMVVKVRDGQVANKPVYVVIGVTVDGERDILGLWAGDGGEGAKFLAECLHRDQEPRRAGRLHRGLRRSEEPTGSDHHDLIRLTVSFTQRPRRQPRGSASPSLTRSGQAVPSDQQAVGERLERVHTVLGLRR
jgi:hypothetical protein